MTDIQPQPLRYTLIIGGETYVLPNAPTGWEESLKTWSRSQRYFGMLRSFTADMEFPLDGAWLLRREFYTRGLRGNAVLVIEEFQPVNWSYRESFRGSVDFSTFIDAKNTVSVSVMETGITEMVKAYEAVQYEIPLNVPNAVRIRVPGVGLVESANSLLEIHNYNIRADFWSILGIDIFVNELDSAYVTAQSVAIPNFNFGGNLFPTSDLWHIRAEQDTSVTLSGRIKGNYTLSRNDQTAMIHIVSSNGGPTGTILYDITNPGLVGESTGGNRIFFDIEFSFKTEIVAGEKLFIAARRIGVNGLVNDFLRIEEGNIKVSNSLVTPDTIVYAMRPFDLFRELLFRMNDYRPVEAQSFLLQGEWSRLLITSGDAIRGIADPKIRTSFQEFYQTMDSLLSVGFGMEAGRAVLEEKRYWMKGNLKAMSVGEVKECTIEPAVEFIYNTIKVGYPDKEYDRELGREEVNSTQQWSTPITRVQKSLDLVSAYRADQIGIEELRTLPSEQNTKEIDKESDNDTFMIKVQSEPGEDGIFDVEGREAYREGDGVYGYSDRNAVYNLDLTPKKNLLRHQGYLRGMLHRFEGRIIRFESAEKNADFRTIDLEGNTVQENVSISISNLTGAYFLPYIAKIKFAIPRSAGEILDTLPTGYMEFSWLGETYRGFFLDAKQDVARGSEQEWKLLLSADTLVEKLIR